MLLQAHLRGEPPPVRASDIGLIMAAAGDISRDLGRAEGDVERYWAAEYMRQHWQRQQLHWRRQRQQQQQQQEPEGLPGVVLGWVRPELNLAAVSLEELGLENVIKVGLGGNERCSVFCVVFLIFGGIPYMLC